MKKAAQWSEAIVLMITVIWVLWNSFTYRVTSTNEVDYINEDLRKIMFKMVLLLTAMAFMTIFWSCYATEVVSTNIQVHSRPERDSGLSVGCILPPLVLLSRLLAQIYGEGIFSSATLCFAWISITIGFSLLVKLTCLRSTGFLSIIVVDIVLLPFVFAGGMNIEQDQRYVIATAGRCLTAVIFHFGRQALPRSFTVGEAMIVSQVIGFGSLDLLLMTLSKIETSSFESIQFVKVWGISSASSRPTYLLALEVGIVCTLLICIAISPILRAYGAPTPRCVSPPLPALPTLKFIGTASVVIFCVLYPWSCLLLSTYNPLKWLFVFVMVELPQRWKLVLYWIMCLVVFVPLFNAISRVTKLRQIVARKLFHLLVVIMFVPAFESSPEMLALSYGVAVAVFSVMECVRAVSLPPLGQPIAWFVQPFIDQRDNGRVILTHTYLLIGCALPLWLVHSFSYRYYLVANTGVLVLGVGDAMGAIVGSTWGRQKLFGAKSYEGTIAVFVSMLLVSHGFHDYFHRAVSDNAPLQLLLLIFGTALTSILEAATSQIDNLVLSLFYFTMTNLITCHR